MSQFIVQKTRTDPQMVQIFTDDLKNLYPSVTPLKKGRAERRKRKVTNLQSLVSN